MSEIDDYLNETVVLEVGEGVALAYAGLLLADAGATVVKIELPAGDCLRRAEPLLLTGSAVFASLNRGKRSLALDWRDERGAAVLSRLLQRADVVVHRVDASDEAQLGRLLAPHAQRLIDCSISSFGPLGPQAGEPGSELVVQAMANFTASVGDWGGEPVRVGADIAEMNTALYSAIGVVAALYERADTGQGLELATSLLGTLMSMRSITWAAQTNPDQWSGFHLEGQYWPGARGYDTSDGQAYFTLHRGTSEDWDRLLIELEMLDVMGDPRFGDYGRGATGTGASDPAVKERFEQAFAAKTTGELLAILRSHGSNAVPFNDYPHLFSDAHAQALGIGSLRLDNGLPVLASPWLGDVEPSQTDMASHLAVPALGQDSLAVLGNLGGLVAAECEQLRDAGIVATP